MLQTAAPSSGPPDLNTHFFAEFDAAKDGPFGSRDFHHLRPRFQRACPCSHVRYTPQPEAGTCGELPEPTAPPEACILAHRLTGTAVQLSWELRAGGHGRRTSSTDVHFGQLEVLECLWPRATSEPEYTEVRAEEELGSGASGQPGLVYLVCPPVDPELPQSLGLSSLLSTLCPPASHTDPAPGAQGNHCCPSQATLSLQGPCVSVLVLILLLLWSDFPFPAFVEPLSTCVV